MTDQNPYRAPAESSDQEGNGKSQKSASDLVQVIDFESDWSAQGLQIRRRSVWHRIGDVGLILIVFLMVGCWMLGRTTFGLFCVLVPVGCFCALLYSLGRRVRSGAAFARKHPALAGPIHGQIFGNVLRVRGPGLEVISRVPDTIYPMMSAKGGLVRLPGVDEALPVMAQDVVQVRSLPGEHTEAKKKRLLDYLPLASAPHFVVSGELHGTDFCNQNCRWRWFLVASTASVFGLLGLVWVGSRYSQLPPWVLDPPGHYHPTAADSGMIVKLWVLGAGAVLLLSVGAWFLFKAFRSFGEYTALLSREMIAISTPRAVFAYREQSLTHFQWTEQGIVIRDCRGQVLFILPRRWFDATESRQAAAWFQQIPSPSRRTYYLLPRV